MEDGIISIYYAEKSIKNTTIGYCSPNDTLFVKYAGVMSYSQFTVEAIEQCR